jgi:hypothetical protein
VPVPVLGAPAEALPPAALAGAEDDVAGGAGVELLEEQAVAVSAAIIAPAIARPLAGLNPIARLRESR